MLGAGAIGAYVGACLVRGGADVTLIARGEHLRAMVEHGVRVHSPRGDFEACPAATSEIEAIADADVVVLGLKAYSLPQLAPRIGELLRPGAVVIAAQNGIPWWYFQACVVRSPAGGRERRPWWRCQPVDRWRAGGGMRRLLLHRDRRAGRDPPHRGHSLLDRPAGGGPDDTCRAISEAFVAGGLKCPVDDDLRPQIWLKLVGNAAFNPITTVTRATLGGLAASPHAVALVQQVMQECAAVAAALGIELPVSLERRLEAGLAVGDHRTSMLQDWMAGKPLEINCMTGAVAEIADMTGVPVPTVRALHGLTKSVQELRDA